MKKIFVFCICLLGGSNVAVAGTCQPIACDPASHDVSELLTVDGYTGGKNSDNNPKYLGKDCFMCDTGGPSECNYKDKVAIVYGGRTRAFQCVDDAGVDDSWENIDNDLCVCGDSPLKSMSASIANASLSTTFRSGSCSSGSKSSEIKNSGRVTNICKYRTCKPGYTAKNGNSCVSNTPAPAPTPTPTPVQDKLGCTYGGKTFKVGEFIVGSCKMDCAINLEDYTHVANPPRTEHPCIIKCVSGDKCLKTCGKSSVCWDILATDATCDPGYLPSKNQKRCVGKDQTPKPKPKPTPVQKSCVEKRKCSSNPNATECAACCMVDAAVAVWDASTNKCNCTDTTKKFDVASGTCLTPTAKKACPEAVILQLAQWKKQCVDNSAIIEAINSLETYCSNPNPEENDTTYNVLYKLITDLHPENCGVAEKAPKKEDYTKEREASREKIADIRNKLNQLKAGLGTSVWKDREGNFNTARLASDSIAGVVLGTAGGLITSNVIKKNQIKGGFEDINCAIGGQTVAGFGDEFQVGIR